MSIYIVKHCNCETYKGEGYKELYVGKLYKEKKGIDNINHLNKYIVECTAMYDMWKNNKDKIIGLCHYRRYFVKEGEILKYKDAEEILKDYDIITTPNYVVGNGIYNNLKGEIGDKITQECLDKYYNKLCDKEPKLREYFNTTSFNPRNMFVCKKEILDKYCEWVMPIIIPLTEEYVKEDYDKCKKDKLMGYLFERLFFYWITKNKLNRYILDYIETGERLYE